MNLLFASMYFDEDVAVVIAEILRNRGFQTLTARDAGRLSVSDDDQLQFASRNQMVMVSHNWTDFAELHQSCLTSGRDHWGIIVLLRRPLYDMADRLNTFLNYFTVDEMKNQFFVV